MENAELGEELTAYTHLQHLTLTQNGFNDVSCIGQLKHLLTVDVSKNNIRSIKFLEDLDNESLQFLAVSGISPLARVRAFQYFQIA